jgi:hypothetical protein
MVTDEPILSAWTPLDVPGAGDDQIIERGRRGICRLSAKRRGEE